MNSKLLTHFLNKTVFVTFQHGSKVFGEEDFAIEGIIVDIDNEFIYIKSTTVNDRIAAFKISLIESIQDAEGTEDIEEDYDKFESNNGGNILN
ncbi:MAG TPA: hypothetical protein VI911_09475 [Patescibacteria group bacterium]|nr:MAG: hypothetical protein UR43_C0005G0122 [candidate division TM6 bacterium GW2011_GWF2_33_332]HLD91228.1 hypothetical protein [Patescibacteria group bacterium]